MKKQPNKWIMAKMMMTAIITIIMIKYKISVNVSRKQETEMAEAIKVRKSGTRRLISQPEKPIRTRNLH